MLAHGVDQGPDRLSQSQLNRAGDQFGQLTPRPRSENATLRVLLVIAVLRQE